MNKSVLIGLVLGLGIATAGGVVAGYKLLGDDSPSQESTAPNPQGQNCREVQVTEQAKPKDEKRIAGTVIGALVGGAVGKDVGHRDITTAAGAAAGALAGNQIQKKVQENQKSTKTVTRCD